MASLQRRPPSYRQASAIVCLPATRRSCPSAAMGALDEDGPRGADDGDGELASAAVWAAAEKPRMIEESGAPSASVARDAVSANRSLS